jgi:hypothetical protein
VTTHKICHFEKTESVAGAHYDQISGFAQLQVFPGILSQLASTFRLKIVPHPYFRSSTYSDFSGYRDESRNTGKSSL